MTRSALERSLPVETATEPIVAWRAWALTGRRDGSHLLLRPVVGRGRPWLPGRPAEAGCRMLGPFHEAPSSRARAASTARTTSTCCGGRAVRP